MTAVPATESIVVPLYRSKKKVAAALLVLFGISMVTSAYAEGLQVGNWVIALVVGVPGLLFLHLAVHTFFRPITWRFELVFDAEGFHYHSPEYPTWTVQWAEMSGITLHKEKYRGRYGIGYLPYLDFWLVDTDAARERFGKLWNAHGAKGHVRVMLPATEKPGPGIERGVGAFRPDLWRADTPEWRAGHRPVDDDS